MNNSLQRNEKRYLIQTAHNYGGARNIPRSFIAKFDEWLIDKAHITSYVWEWRRHHSSISGPTNLVKVAH